MHYSDHYPAALIFSLSLSISVVLYIFPRISVLHCSLLSPLFCLSLSQDTLVARIKELEDQLKEATFLCGKGQCNGVGWWGSGRSLLMWRSQQTHTHHHPSMIRYRETCHVYLLFPLYRAVLCGAVLLRCAVLQAARTTPCAKASSSASDYERPTNNWPPPRCSPVILSYPRTR